jgi:hypothetical protein
LTEWSCNGCGFIMISKFPNGSKCAGVILNEIDTIELLSGSGHDSGSSDYRHPFPASRTDSCGYRLESFRSVSGPPRKR